MIGMELIDSGEQGTEEKNIKNRAYRTNHKYDYKRYKIWKKKWEIELKEMIFSCGHDVRSLTLNEIANLESLVGQLTAKVTAKQMRIKGLEAERDSWIDKCEKHKFVSKEYLEDLARCKGEISRGREDRLNKIVGLNIQLEEFLGHSMDLEKKLELQMARLQCENEIELEFEIKELKFEIKGLEDDCELAATADHEKLKKSCLNTLRNEIKRSETVNLQLEDEFTRKELVIQLLQCVKGFPLQEKMETTGQKNQEFTCANELVWNDTFGSLVHEGMNLPGMKEANDFIYDHEGNLSCTVEELLGDSSTRAEASSSKQVFSVEFSKLDCGALLRPSGPSVTLTDAARLLTVEKGKSVMLEGNDDAPRGRGRGRRGRSSRGRSNGSRGRGLTRNASLPASLASIDAGKRLIVSVDPNPRPQQRLRPISVTTPIPSPAVQEMSLWNSFDVTKSRAATLFSESDNAAARKFLNTCTPEDVQQLNCFKLLNVCQVAIQEAHSHGAELAMAKREAEQAFAREKVALSTVEHLKKELAHEKAERSKLDKTNASLELQVRRDRRAYVDSWLGSQSFANTLVPLKDYQYAMGFSKCRALIAGEDPDYDISWLRATPTERFKWDGCTLMLEPLMPPPVYFDEDGGVPPHPPQYAREEPYEDEVPFPSEDGGQAPEEE